MDRLTSDVIIINGLVVPAPDAGYNIKNSVVVDAARNANAVVVGQVKGPPEGLFKIENLKWSSLSPEQWKQLRTALLPFYVPVTFTDDFNTRQTLVMYPGDKTCTPYHVENLTYEKFKDCKFNLVDTGKR